MSDEKPQAASEGGIGQSASTAGLERMVREAGWSGIYTQWVSPTKRESMTVPVTQEQVFRFAAIVAAEEREACAEVCRKRARAMRETIRTANPRTSEHIMLRRDARLEEANDCAAEIMERSNAGVTGAEPKAERPR